MTISIPFARRPNHDASIDSICTRCYQTIASAYSPGDLEIHERTHRCDPNGEFNLHYGGSQRGVS